MNDLLTESFEINRNQSSRSGDIELGNAAHSGELALEAFFKKVQEIDKQYDKLSVLLRKLQDAQEELKSVTKAGAMKAIKQQMQKDVDEVEKIARAIKSKIEELDKDNFASRQKPGCGKGTAVDRSRSSTTLALKKKFKDKMGKFQTLRENIHQEYREVVERRVYTVTGKHADEETIDQLIETGDSEQIFQKAIQEQGRGQIMDTVSEIHERHDVVREVERKCLELQQIFMDMAVLVDAQGDMLDNIESQKHRKLERNKSREDDKDFGGNSAQPMVTSETSDVTCVSNRSYRIKDNVEYELKPSSKSLKKNAKEVMTKKTKFEEYLDMENEVPTAEEDLEMERRLAKKLKVKNGKLGGYDDELNFLLGGSDEEYGSLNDDTNIIDIIETKGKKKKKKRETLEQDMEVSGDDKLREDRGTELSEADLIHLKTGIETEDVKKKEKKVKGKRKKTKFEEYLAIENTGTSTTEEDLKLERRLAKKLKVKDGKLPGDDDGISFLFGDSEQEYAPQNDDFEIIKTTETKNKKKKKKKKGETLKKDVEAVSGDGTSDKIIHENDNPSRSIEDHVAKANAEAPRSNTYVAPHMRASSSTDPNGNLPVRRRIRGLLNRLTESNMESITREVFALFESTGRSVASQIVAEEVLASCAGGPRGNEQYAAAFAAFVSGLTCMVGIDFGAKLLVFLAKSFEEEYLKKDNLSLRNLTLLLSYLYTFGVCSSDLIYDFLVMLSKQMTEIDVSTILTILQCCGMKLRSDDPAAMKEFIHGVQNRVTELKASSGDENTKTSGRRMQFMLETICDIKNNKKRKEELPQHTRVKKWLQKLRVDDVSIHGVKWSKLLDPEKKGQWWLTGDLASTDNVEEVAITIDKEVLEAQKMLELAASQRMNTDVRKAIFCVIMSGEDYLDAFEKLIRLDLQGKQDREIMRVLLECCLQEKVFNKYYTALAIKLCHHEKNHKFTLQYCLWDQFKELDSMPLLRSMHLAKFLAEMLASFTLSLAVLKAVDLSDIVQLSPKRIMHFRMLFDTVFAHPDNVVWNVFTRIAVTPELEALRVGMEFFIMEHVLPSNVNVKKKFKLAKKSLSNTEGVLL